MQRVTKMKSRASTHKIIVCAYKGHMIGLSLESHDNIECVINGKMFLIISCVALSKTFLMIDFIQRKIEGSIKEKIMGDS